MCLVTNEGRAPACTAGPPLRLPRPPAASLQVAGGGGRAALVGGGRPGGARAGPPACGPACAAQEPAVGISATPFSSRARKEGRNERRKEARKEGTDSMEGSGGGALGLRVHRPQNGSPRGGLPGGARRRVGAVCMRVPLCVCPGTGKGHVCLGCALWGAGSAPLCLFPEVGGTLARSGNVP